MPFQHCRDPLPSGAPVPRPSPRPTATGGEETPKTADHTRVTFRPARASDFHAFVDILPQTVRAITAVREADGAVLGIGGVYYDGGNVIAFSHMRPDLPRRDRIRGAHRIMDIVRTINAPVYAIAGPYESAPGMLRHLGFESIADSHYYLW